MNKFQIVALAALLAGCASVPEPMSQPDVTYQAIEQDAETLRQAEAQAQQTARELELLEQPRTFDRIEQHCLAQAMYWEARGEGQQGMVAVAAVVLNRVEDERFPDSVCNVVYQGGESPPCQFSWWCDGKADHPANPAMWTESLSLAETILTERPLDPTEGALFYHNTSIRAPWRRPLTTRIGNHIFYR